MIKPTREFLDKLDAFIGTLTEDEKNMFALFIKAFGDPVGLDIFESMERWKKENK